MLKMHEELVRENLFSILLILFYMSIHTLTVARHEVPITTICLQIKESSQMNTLKSETLLMSTFDQKFIFQSNQYLSLKKIVTWYRVFALLLVFLKYKIKGFLRYSLNEKSMQNCLKVF